MSRKIEQLLLDNQQSDIPHLKDKLLRLTIEVLGYGKLWLKGVLDGKELEV